MAQASAPAGPSENGLLTACLPPRKRFQARSGRRPSRQRKSPCGCPVNVPRRVQKATQRETHVQSTPSEVGSTATAFISCAAQVLLLPPGRCAAACATMLQRVLFWVAG